MNTTNNNERKSAIIVTYLVCLLKHNQTHEIHVTLWKLFKQRTSKMFYTLNY